MLNLSARLQPNEQGGKDYKGKTAKEEEGKRKGIWAFVIPRSSRGVTTSGHGVAVSRRAWGVLRLRTATIHEAYYREYGYIYSILW